MRNWKIIGLFKENRKQKRLFFTILSYFMSLLIPIVIVGTSVYWYSSKVMKGQFDDRMSANLVTSTNVVDNYLRSAQETGINFLNDLTVQRLLKPKEEHTKETMSELWRIKQILQRNENIIGHFTDEMFVYIDDKSIYVSAGVNDFDFYFNKVYRYEQYDMAFWRERLHANVPGLEVLPMSVMEQDRAAAGRKVVPIVIHENIGRHKAVLVINISIEAIEREIQGSKLFESTSFLILDSNHHVLSDGKGIFQSYFGADRQALVSTLEEETPRMLTVDGTRYITTHHQSSLFGWNYYSFTPLSEYNRHTNSILAMTFVICFVLLIMGIIFSFIFSLRIYNPIRNIRDILARNHNVSDEGTSSSDMFSLIQQSIDQLTDRHERYKTRHDQYTHEYVERALMFLLKGHTLNEEEILWDSLRTDFGFDRAGFVCCTVLFDFKEVFFEDIQDAERMGLISGIKKIIWAVLENKAPAYVLDHHRNVFVCLININDKTEIEQITDAFSRMLNIFEYDIRKYYDIAIGIGQYYETINDLAASYNEAITAMSMMNKDSRFQITHSDELEIGASYLYSFSDEQKLFNYLKLGDEEGLRSTVNGIVRVNFNRNIFYEQMLKLFNELYMTGNRFLAERGIDAAQFNAQRQSLLMNPAHDDFYYDGKQLEEDVIQYYLKIIHSTTEISRTSDLTTLIEQYIQENYTQDLGLERIADEMGFSVKYVSRVFKEKVGVNLSEYITRLRIEKAKELLRNSDLRMKDVGENVGIYSRSTFQRVFKKVEGITPNEYRNMYVEER